MMEGTVHITKEDEKKQKGEAPECFLEELWCKQDLVQNTMSHEKNSGKISVLAASVSDNV